MNNHSPYRMYGNYLELPTMRDSYTHQGEHGNLSVDDWAVDITSEMLAYQNNTSNGKVGSMLLVDELNWDQTYRKITIIGEKAAGLVVDLGIRDLDSGQDYPTLFADAVAVDALDADGRMRTELLNHPFRMYEALNMGIRHAFLVTLRGTVTNGDRFWIQTERVNIGSH